MDFSRRALFQAAVSIFKDGAIVKCCPVNSTGMKASVPLPFIVRLVPGEMAEFVTKFEILAPVRAWGVEAIISTRLLAPSGPIVETIERNGAYPIVRYTMAGDTLINRLTLSNLGEFPFEVIGLWVKLSDVDPTAIRRVKASRH